ncbi:hypothetical protein DFH27DRAFT_44830 [Peziza echinospora]|nr:hypothetical protein DFH27DRAFT_44830 [Peziza echinospora]
MARDRAPTDAMIEAWLALPSHYSFSSDHNSSLSSRPSSVPVMSPTRTRTNHTRPDPPTNSSNVRSTIMYVTDGVEAPSKATNALPAPPPVPTYVTSITMCTRKTTKKTNTITISSRRALQQAEKQQNPPVPKVTTAKPAATVTAAPKPPATASVSVAPKVQPRRTAVPVVSIPTVRRKLPIEIPQFRRNDELHIPEEMMGSSSLPGLDLGPGIPESILATRMELMAERNVRKIVSSDGLIPVAIEFPAQASNTNATRSRRGSRNEAASRSRGRLASVPRPVSANLEFQIHAEDVIPMHPTRPTTPVRRRTKTWDKQEILSPVSVLSHLTPRREARWDLDGPISPVSEPDLNELHFPNEFVTRSSWGSTGRNVVKRKPAPSVRVHSLPMLIINKEHMMDCHGTLSSSSDGSPYLSPAGAGPRDDLDKLFGEEQTSSPMTRFLTALRNESSPTGTECSGSPTIKPNSPTIKSPICASDIPANNFNPPTNPTTDWRSLSFLDLTSTDELLIYLQSLTLIRDSEGQSQGEGGFIDSSRFCSTATSPSINSRFSFYSDLPSPSSYNPLTSLPMPIPREPLRIGDIHLGQLRLTPQSTIYIPLDISLKVFEPNAQYNNPFGMPCRTTILTGTRRVTFVKPAEGSREFVQTNSLEAPLPKRSLTIGSGKGLINRDNSKRIRSRGGTILRHRGRDIYLELVDLGSLTGAMAAPPLFDVFLNRVDGSVWLVYNPRQSEFASGGVLDCWAFSTLGITRKGKEKVLAVRWADGLDCVHEFRGGNLGPVVARMARVGGRRGEMEIECGVVEMEGVEVYLGENVREEEDGWFVPEGF